MNKSYIIDAERLLIISDPHQDIFWVKAVIEKEQGNYDHILINGDWFDSHKSDSYIYGAKGTAKFIIELMYGAYGPCSFNLGNHDAPIMEAWRFNRQFQQKRYLFNACSGYTNSKSIEVNKVFEWKDWRKFHLFHQFGDYIISHAGIHPSFWSSYKTTEENLDFLWKETEEALELITVMPSKYFAAGLARGGRENIGGFIWQDWNLEFVDGLPLGQIVGHTQKYNTVRKIKQSYCIDGGQSTYAIVNIHGHIEFKSLTKLELSGLWVEQKHLFEDMSTFYVPDDHAGN